MGVIGFWFSFVSNKVIQAYTYTRKMHFALISVGSVSSLKTVYKLPFGISYKKLRMIYLNVPFASPLLFESRSILVCPAVLPALHLSVCLERSPQRVFIVTSMYINIWGI